MERKENVTTINAIEQHQTPLHHHLESIPDQVGIAILRSNDGSILHPPTGSLCTHDVQILYRMLLEIGGILLPSNSSGSEKDEELLKRFNVEMGGDLEKISYTVCLTQDGFVYIVKKSISNPPC